MFIVEIRVKPNASKAYVGGIYGERLIVSVQAPAVDGKANKAVMESIAKAFDVKQNAVAIIHGLTSRDKRISITGNESILESRLRELRGDLL